MSNKNGPYSVVKIKIATFSLFPYITPKKDFDPLLAHGKELTEELLRETTNLKAFNKPVVATPNFFVIYHGQNVPHDDIMSDKVKAKMMHLVTGYDPMGKNC